MKSPFFFKPLIFVALIIFFSCQDPIEGVQIGIDANLLYDANVTVEFINANTEISKAPEDIQVEITGPDTDYVIDLGGNRNFTTDGGLLGLALISLETEDVSEENPIEFTISAIADGYLPATSEVRITELTDDSFNLITVPMLEVANLPDGVGLLEVELELDPATGATTKAVSIDSESDNGRITRSGKLAISIPEGTQFLNEEGKVIVPNESDLNLYIYYISREETFSRFVLWGIFDRLFPIDNFNSYPNPEVSNDLNKMMRPLRAAQIMIYAGKKNTFGGVTVTRGFTVDGRYQQIESFSKPLEVEVEIDKKILNPEKNYQPVSAGDNIPVFVNVNPNRQFSYRYIEEAILKNENERLIAQLQTHYITTFTGWGWRPELTGQVPWSNWRQKTISHNITEDFYDIRVELRVTNVANDYIVYRTFPPLRILTNEFQERLLQAGRIGNWMSGSTYQNSDTKVEIYHFKNKIGETQVFSPQNNEEGELNIDISSMPTPTTISFSASCPDGSNKVLIPDNLMVWYRAPEQSRDEWQFFGTTKNGKVTASDPNLKIGETYYFFIFYKGRIEYPHTIQGINSELEIEIPIDICNDINN